MLALLRRGAARAAASSARSVGREPRPCAPTWSPHDRSLYSSLSDLLAAVTVSEPSRLEFKHVKNVPLGSTLVLDLQAARADVALVCGDPESVAVSVVAAGGGAAADLRAALRHSVDLDQEGARATIRLAGTGSLPAGAALTVTAVVPPRYFSLDIRTGGGSVSIQGVKEGGRVEVRSGGGGIAVAAVHAAVVSLRSGGGGVSGGGVTGESVEIDTRAAEGQGPAGEVQLRSVTGVGVAVAAGAVRVGACYAGAASFRCTSFQADSLRCLSEEADGWGEGGAVVEVGGGGRVDVGGVDGRLEVRVGPGGGGGGGGGGVRAQLNDGAQRVHIDVAPGGGAPPSSVEVELFLSPGLHAALDLRECGAGWELPEGAAVAAADAHSARAEVLPTGGGRKAGAVAAAGEYALSSRLQRGAGERAGGGGGGAAAAACAVGVRGGGGARVQVRRRSWMDGVMQRMGGDKAGA